MLDTDLHQGCHPRSLSLEVYVRPLIFDQQLHDVSVPGEAGLNERCVAEHPVGKVGVQVGMLEEGGEDVWVTRGRGEDQRPSLAPASAVAIEVNTRGQVLLHFAYIAITILD